MKDSIIKDKTKDFALRIIKLYKYLTLKAEPREFVLSKQVLRSGTSIGANVKEALRGQSRPDFRAKMSIALKEASETEYWLELLYESDYIDEQSYSTIINDNIEIIRILTRIVKNSE
jgi:four helix bundle protein